MLYGLYLSASGMQAQEKRHDVISNNLANAGTTGFKRDLALARARPSAPMEDVTMGQYRAGMLAKQGGGVLVENAGVELKQASLEHTGVSTDLALQGDGFFVVQGENASQPALTRDGRMMINNEGTLVAATSGRPMLSAEGQVIKLDPSLPVTVDGTGKVSQGDPANAVQLKLVDVTDPRQVIKMGANLMTVNDPNALKDVSPSTMVRQDYLEQSGVDPVIEMVNMIEGQRAFDANAKMISLQDTTLQEINTIGKIA